MLHIKHSQGWITNFLKGDSLSQRVVDLEATHMGDAVPPTQYIHFHTKIQQHNITHKATLASLSTHHRQSNIKKSITTSIWSMTHRAIAHMWSTMQREHKNTQVQNT